MDSDLSPGSAGGSGPSPGASFFHPLQSGSLASDDDRQETHTCYLPPASSCIRNVMQGVAEVIMREQLIACPFTTCRWSAVRCQHGQHLTGVKPLVPDMGCSCAATSTATATRHSPRRRAPPRRASTQAPYQSPCWLAAASALQRRPPLEPAAAPPLQRIAPLPAAAQGRPPRASAAPAAAMLRRRKWWQRRRQRPKRLACNRSCL